MTVFLTHSKQTLIWIVGKFFKKETSCRVFTLSINNSLMIHFERKSNIYRMTHTGADPGFSAGKGCQLFGMELPYNFADFS